MEDVLTIDVTDPRFLIVVAALVLTTAFLIYKRTQSSKPVVSYKAIQKPSALGKAGTSARDEDIDDGKPRITFLVGSQTGTAEDYARRLARDGTRFGFRTKVIEMADYDTDKLEKEPFVFVVVSTYGEGDPPDNALDFVTWITDDGREDDLLKNVKYTVFSLGNKTYTHYQSMGRKLDKRFEMLGAERLFERGEGDDDGTLEDDFLAWQARAWPVLCSHFGLEYREGGDTETLEPKCKLVWHDETNPPPNRLVVKSPLIDAKNPYHARIVADGELHRTPERSCRHVEFDVSGSIISYSVGDHLGIYPENDPQMVQALAERLGADLDAPFSLLSTDPTAKAKSPLPVPCTIREAFTHHLEIAYPPRKICLQAFAQYAKDEQEKQHLLLLSANTPEGKAAYEAEIHSKAPGGAYSSMLAVLRRFPSVQPNVGHFMELMPHMGVRYYSISSSPKMYPQTIHITAVVTGVCTSHLKRVGELGLKDVKLPVFVRPSTFRLPRLPTTPIVMVGPGTGLAPFRGFIEERYQLRKAGATLGPALLFFGCRHPDHDYIYQNELETAVQDGIITELKVAFSRLGASKVYVQHLMLEQKHAIWQSLNDSQGHLYICGDAKAMAKDVASTLRQIVRECGNMSETEAGAWVEKLTAAHRYHQDVW